MGQGFGGMVEQAWQQLQVQAIQVVPRVFASLVVSLLGVLAAVVVGRAARWVLKSAHVDRRAARLGLGSSLETIGITSSAAAIVRAIQCAILAATSILALYSIDRRLASDLAEQFLLYVPHLLAGAAIFGGGMVLARFAARSVLIAAVNAEVPWARALAGLTRAAVVITAGAIALEQLGIGRLTVLVAFTILFGGVTLAAAIAVGFGAQDVVRQWVAGRTTPVAPDPGGPEHW
jgi:hypothetical protein